MMRATVTLVFVLILSLVVWRGQGLAQSPLVELEAGLSHGVHPAVLALVKPGEAIHVSPAAFAVQAYGSGQLVTFSGVEFDPATIDLCERSKRRADRPAEFYPLHIGLSASELEALLNQRDFRLLDSNLMDSPDHEFPRLRISAASDGFHLEQPAGGQNRVVTDSHLMNQFKRIAVVADEQAQTLLLIQHVKKANCALGEFRVRNFQLDDSPKKKWFAIISADQDVKPVTGDVQAGDYFRDYEQLDGVSALATAALECGAVYQEAEGEPWRVASRYQMSDLPAINRNPKFVASKHCRGVLKALYSTNNGTVVRERVKRLNHSQAPLVAVKLAEPAPLSVTRVENGAPLSPVAGALPGGREALLYTNPHETTGGWLQGDEAIELSAAVTKPVSLYVVGNAQVQQGEVITRQNLCIKRLCEEGDVELLLLKPSAHGRIQLTIQPLATKPFLLQEQTTRLDAPQTAAEKMPLASTIAANEVLYRVADRHGVGLDDYAIPQLVGRWQGAPIPMDAAEPRALTLDLAFHQQVQQQLSEFLKTLPEHAQRHASFSVANAQGELLALAQWPLVGVEQNLERLAFINQTNPATSPLTLQAAYHNGAQQNVSGSVFKLVSALYMADLPAEMTRKTLTAWQAGEHQQQGFDPYARCYPFIKLACAKGAINIFSHQGMALTLANRMQRYGDASFGVAEAIRDSNNTYFASGVEQALPSHLIDQNYIAAQSLGQGDLLNPVLNLADQLGFRSQVAIPGSSSRSEFGSINSRAKLWRFAVGEQNKVTALHVLQMTLAIAKGEFQPLGVLLGERGTAQALPISEQAFAEVRHGMAMAAASYGAFKPFLPALTDSGITLHAKTGTGSFVAVGEDAAERTLHNTYLTGYLHSVQSQPLVFTCRISHVDQLAGEVCGALVARLMPLLVSQFDPSLLLLFPAVSEVSLNPLGV